MANIPYPQQYDDSFMNIFKRIIDELNSMGYTYEQALIKAGSILEKAEKTNNMNVSVQEQLDSLVIESGNANAEVSQARGYNDLLYQRLDGLEQANFETDRKRSFDSLVSKKVRKPIITWIDDDGNEGFISKLMPLAREYGIKMTSAVITNTGHGFPIEGAAAHVERQYSYEQMIAAKEEGIAEFICHTHTHDINNKLTDMTVEEMHEELKTNRDIMKKLGFNYKHLVYAFGAFNDDVISVVKQYFDSAFRVGGPGGNATGNIVEDPFDQFSINRVSVDGNVTAAQVIEMIDKAYANDSWIVLNSHVDQVGGLDMQKARDIIEHALSLGMEFVTVEEGVNLRGNLAQFGGTTIDSRGVVHSDDLGIVQHIGDAYTDIQDRSLYRNKKMYIQKVKSFEASSYGLPGAGIMFTYKDNENTYDFRKFVQTYNNARDDLMSYFDKDAGVWSEWLSNSAYVYRGTKLNPDSPLSDFPVNTVTMLKVTNSSAPTYGLPNAGTVEAFRDVESNYSYQVFTPHSSYNLKPRMIRYYNSGTWTSWRNEILARRYDRDFSDKSVPANSTRTYATSASLSQDHVITIKPAFDPPDGLLYDVFVQSNGNFVCRFVNVTDSSINLGGPWVVRVLEI